MNKNLKNIRNRSAVFLFDGTIWRAFSFRRRKATTISAAGQLDRLPRELLAFAKEQKSGEIRILISGGLKRLETSMPPRLKCGEVNTLLANEIAESLQVLIELNFFVRAVMRLS